MLVTLSVQESPAELSLDIRRRICSMQVKLGCLHRSVYGGEVFYLEGSGDGSVLQCHAQLKLSSCWRGAMLDEVVPY
jgi:hypothetical protein